MVFVPSRQPTISTNVPVITTITTSKATTGEQQHFESITIILDDDRVIFNGTKVNMTLIEGKGIAIITTTTSGEEIPDVFKEEPIPATPISNVGDFLKMNSIKARTLSHFIFAKMYSK
jgi:hypothetical protein